MVQRAYGVHLLKYGRVEEGLAALTQAMERLRRGRARDFDFVYTLAWNVAAETEAGHYRQAEAMLEEADAIVAKFGGKPTEKMDDLLLARAAFLLANGKGDQAAQYLQNWPAPPEAARKISYLWLDVSLAHAEAELAQGHAAGARERVAEVQKRLEGSGVAGYFKRW